MPSLRKDDAQRTPRPAKYRRKVLEDMMGGSTAKSAGDVAPLIFDINFSGCSPTEKATLYRQIEQNIRPIHGHQGQYEAVYTGTSQSHLRFSVRLHTAGAADVILADMEDGTFLKTFVEKVKPKFQKDAVKIQLLYSSEQLRRVKMYTRAGRLSGDLFYTFCSKRRQWYWSHGEVTWYSCYNVPVAIDGLRPKEADGDVISRLRSYKCPLPPKEVDCPICQKYASGMKDDLHEYIPVKQDLTLTFAFSDSGCLLRCDANQPQDEPPGRPEKDAEHVKVDATTEDVKETDVHEDVKGSYELEDVKETKLQEDVKETKLKEDVKETDVQKDVKAQAREEELRADAPPSAHGGATVEDVTPEVAPPGAILEEEEWVRVEPAEISHPQRYTSPPTGSEDAALNASEAMILQKLQDAIYRIEIVKGDADNVREQLKKVTYVQWSERVRVDRYFGIADFGAFTDDLRAMMGFPERECRALAMIHKHMDAGDSKEFEMTYKEDTMKVRYALFALSKRGQKTDIIFTTYSMDATRGPDPGKVKKAGFLGGLFGGKASENEPTLDADDERVKSYFRLKAVEGFTGEGLVDRARLNIK